MAPNKMRVLIESVTTPRKRRVRGYSRQHPSKGPIMSDPTAGNHFHGNAVIGIQNTGGTIHNVQVNQQGAHAGPRTYTQQASDILQALSRRIEEARVRGDVAEEDAEDAMAIIDNAPADAETEESRS
jgi:hypothetical protein